MRGIDGRWAGGSLGFLTASVFWGLNIPLTAALLGAFDPFWVSPLRYLIASALLGTWLVLVEGVGALRSPIPWRRIARLSLLVSAFLVLFTSGLAIANPISASAMIAGSPVYVAVVSRIWLRAPLERGFWGATLLTLVGAGIAIAGRADAGASRVGATAPWPGTGEALIVLAIGCWTVYSVLAQRWFAPAVSQLRRTFLSAIAAIPWLLLFWALAWAVGLVGAPNLRPGLVALANLAVSAICCTALATVCWNIGVSRLGIATGGLWQNTVPVFGVLISLTAYGVVPSRAEVIGGAVVLAGVLYLQWRRWRAV